MLYKLWQLIQLWLPYWVVIRLYKYKKAIPTNIKTKSGRNYKATMITTDYGILFSTQEYVKNRTKVLKEKQAIINNQNTILMDEINKLSFEAREELFNNPEEE